MKAEAKKAKEAAAEKEKKNEEYMKEWRRLYEKEQARFVKARDKYDADMVKFKQGEITEAPAKPEFKDPVVRRKGGGRTRRRHRRSRSTRRR